MKRHKISVIGAGNVGAAAAHIMMMKELGDIVLVDIVEGVPQGKALDMGESTPVEKVDSSLTGSNTYDVVKDSDVVVITAGLPRKSDMSREDLLKKNVAIVKSVSENVKKFAPNSIIIVVSNPLDAMVYTAFKATNFPRERVFGMAGILDSTRYRYFIASALGVSVESVQGMVLGGHGDQMIPVTRFTSVGGIPISHFLKQDELDKIVERTRKGGAEFIPLLKTTAYYAPGSSIAEMVEAIVKDKKKILPCAALLEGEFGEKGVFIGVPVKVGSAGMEGIIEFDLKDAEKDAFSKNVAHVRGLQKEVDADFNS